MELICDYDAYANGEVFYDQEQNSIKFVASNTDKNEMSVFNLKLD